MFARRALVGMAGLCWAVFASTSCSTDSDCAFTEICECDGAISPASRPTAPLLLSVLLFGVFRRASAESHCRCVQKEALPEIDDAASAVNASSTVVEAAAPANGTSAAACSTGDPAIKIYLGNGCFWHTQYDLVVAERGASGPFEGRPHIQITSRVGYAGGTPNDLVCYHHGPPGSDYGQLGHTEVAEVLLDEACAEDQFSLLLEYYFGHGFMEINGKWSRLDPQDFGPAYRNAIGLPGGMSGAMFPIVEAMNVNNMEMREGLGGDFDDVDNYVIYIYDSDEWPFYVGETYHQFHPNWVVRRELPNWYLTDTPKALKAAGMLSSPCDD